MNQPISAPAPQSAFHVHLARGTLLAILTLSVARRLVPILESALQRNNSPAGEQSLRRHLASWKTKITPIAVQRGDGTMFSVEPKALLCYWTVEKLAIFGRPLLRHSMLVLAACGLGVAVVVPSINLLAWIVLIAATLLQLSSASLNRLVAKAACALEGGLQPLPEPARETNRQPLKPMRGSGRP